MNFAVLRKSARQYAWLWLGAIAFVAGFAIFYMLATQTFSKQQAMAMLRMEWIRQLLSSLIGADLAESVSATGFASFVFAHPFTWAILVSFVFTVASGLLSGEMDRGTMDLLATLSVSRTSIYASVSCVVLAMGVPLCAAVYFGTWYGRSITLALEVRMDILALVAVHLFTAYVFLACFALGVSACVARRGSALVLLFAPIFYSFVLNLISAYWAPARRVAWTSFLQYYRPLPIVREERLLWADMLVLLAAAAVWWTAGLIAFRRRDIPAR